jgi:phosphatidylinositol alpha-1,6-mannosyltransferase
LTSQVETTASPSILGLFPAWGSGSIGGVQASGRIAWEGIRIATQNIGGNAELFCYGSSGSEGETPERSFSSKSGAVLGALSRKREVNKVLVWHSGLIKLLPFFRVPNAKVFLFLHGIEVWKKPGLLTRTLLKRVDCFLTNSQYTWHRFIEYHPWLSGTQHKLIHLGIGTPIATAIPKPNELPMILMISRLSRSENYKGHREMIAAWPLVLKRNPQAQLWIVGEGDLRPELDVLVKSQGLGPSIKFLGAVSESQKLQLLTECRCLALPSRAEGFGLVYLEAMRLGRPCLVSLRDAGREVINPPEAGLAVNSENPETLADAILQMLTPGSEWSQWSYQAQRRYEATFTVQHFQQRLTTALLLN